MSRVRVLFAPVYCGTLVDGLAPVFHRVRSTCAIPFYPPNIPQSLRRIDDDNDETRLSKGKEDRKGIEGEGDYYC